MPFTPKSKRITLAPFVLPRLLARSWPALFSRQGHDLFLDRGYFNPRTFITHAIWLGQAFAHCPSFLTAASKRSPSRVSVSMWPMLLLDRLRIFGLVSFLDQLPNPKKVHRKATSTLFPIKEEAEFLKGNDLCVLRAICVKNGI